MSKFKGLCNSDQTPYEKYHIVMLLFSSWAQGLLHMNLLSKFDWKQKSKRRRLIQYSDTDT